jgi:hypothetical protein
MRPALTERSIVGPLTRFVCEGLASRPPSAASVGLRRCHHGSTRISDVAAILGPSRNSACSLSAFSAIEWLPVIALDLLPLLVKSTLA